MVASQQHNKVADLHTANKAMMILELDPKIVDFRPEHNLRSERPTLTDIKEFAETIRFEGQLQPILVKEEKSGEYQYTCVVGFRRATTIDWMNKNLKKGEKPYKIKAILWDGSDMERVRANIQENTKRKDLTPIDKKDIIKKLRAEPFNMKDKAIAPLFGWKSEASVTQHMKLDTLEESIQKRISSGEISLEGAVVIADTPVEKRAAVLKEVAPITSPIDPATGKAHDRIKSTDIKEAAARAGATKGIGIMKMPELRKYLQKVFQDPEQNSGFAAICFALAALIAREATEKAVQNAAVEGTVESEKLRKQLTRKGVYKTAEETDEEEED